jgi:hypothetical protein
MNAPKKPLWGAALIGLLLMPAATALAPNRQAPVVETMDDCTLLGCANASVVIFGGSCTNDNPRVCTWFVSWDASCSGIALGFCFAHLTDPNGGDVRTCSWIVGGCTVDTPDRSGTVTGLCTTPIVVTATLSVTASVSVLTAATAFDSSSHTFPKTC